MSVNLGVPEATKSKLKPRVLVLGVGGGGCNALNTMIASGLKGVEFVACNTDSQSLEFCNAKQKIQLGVQSTQGLGAGSDPTIGKSAAEESYNDICEYIDGSHMAFIAAGMGGGTGTGAVSTIAKACKEKGILTVAVVTKPFSFEGKIRMDNAEKGIEELRSIVDTIIVIPNQNLYIVCDDKTSFAEAFCMADQVLHAGVRAVTDLIMMPGLINLDFADVRTVMSEMGRAVFGNGEAAGERRAIEAAEAAISNPLLERVSLEGAKGLLLNITGGSDMSLTEVSEAADRIKQEVEDNAKIIFGSSINKELDGMMRVSIIATGIGNVVDMHNPKTNKAQEKEKNEDLLQNITSTMKPKITEQTDLEDFTDPIVGINKNTTTKVNTEKKMDDFKGENQQEKPSNIVLDFIKKLSPLKIFNRNKKTEEEDDNPFDNNHSIITKEDTVKEKEETIINNEEEEKQEIRSENPDPKPLEKQEIRSENSDPKPLEKDKKIEITIKENELKPQENKSDLETKKEKKTVQIQSEMSGLDEKISEDSNDEKEGKEDLEIPSFLRNQSN